MILMPTYGPKKGGDSAEASVSCDWSSLAEVRQPTMDAQLCEGISTMPATKNHKEFAKTPACKASPQRRARSYLLYFLRAGVTGMSCENQRTSTVSKHVVR